VLTNSKGSHFAVLPEDREKLVFEVSEGRQRWFHSVTVGNMLLVVTLTDADLNWMAQHATDLINGKGGTRTLDPGIMRAVDRKNRS